MTELKLQLHHKPLRFNRASIDRKSRSLVLTWYADTEIANVAFLRVVVLRLGKPFFQQMLCYTNA